MDCAGTQESVMVVVFIGWALFLVIVGFIVVVFFANRDDPW
jgi:hypothetical protein